MLSKQCEIFGKIMIASRTKSKCDKLKAQLDGKTKQLFLTAQVDAVMLKS